MGIEAATCSATPSNETRDLGRWYTWLRREAASLGAPAAAPAAPAAAPAAPREAASRRSLSLAAALAEWGMCRPPVVGVRRGEA